MNGATYHWAIVGTGEAEVRLMEVKDNYAFNRLIARVVLTVDGWKATIENVPTSLLVGHFEECQAAQGAVMAELVANRLTDKGNRRGL